MLRSVTVVLAAFLIAVAPTAYAQSPRPRFEVASVKSDSSCTTRPRTPQAMSPGRLNLGTAPPVAPAKENDLSIVTALEEQLGLKLESAKGPVDVLVVDSVSKPMEN